MRLLDGHTLPPGAALTTGLRQRSPKPATPRNAKAGTPGKAKAGTPRNDGLSLGYSGAAMPYWRRHPEGSISSRTSSTVI